jgi:hypothetical protein
MSLRVLVAVVLSIVLGACASEEQAGELAAGADPGRYDAARAEQLVRDAQEAAARSDPAAAEAAFEGALDAWPASKPAWDGLTEIFRAQGRQEELEVARFFVARMDWVAAVPPLIASGAFDNVSKGRVEISHDSPDLRRRSAELVDFLRTRDALAHARAQDTHRGG